MVRRYRLVSLVVLCCAAASVGCGTGIGSDAVPAATSTAAGSGEAPASGAASGAATPDGGSGADASTPTEGELLAAADLPAGAKLQSIDIAKLAAALASAARQITFDPPQCGQLSTRSLGDPSNLQGVAVLASIGNPTSAAQITESVLGKQPSVSIAGLRMALQACGNASGKGSWRNGRGDRQGDRTPRCRLQPEDRLSPARHRWTLRSRRCRGSPSTTGPGSSYRNPRLR